MFFEYFLFSATSHFMLLLRINVITSVSSYFADYITAIDVHLYIYLFYQPTGNLYFSYWGLFNIRLFHFLWLCVTFVKYFNTIHSHGALMLHLVTEELNLSTFVYFIFNNLADSSCFYIKYESQLSETCREVKSTIFPSELQQRRRIKSKYCGTKT